MFQVSGLVKRVLINNLYTILSEAPSRTTWTITLISENNFQSLLTSVETFWAAFYNFSLTMLSRTSVKPRPPTKYLRSSWNYSPFKGEMKINRSIQKLLYFLFYLFFLFKHIHRCLPQKHQGLSRELTIMH